MVVKHMRKMVWGPQGNFREREYFRARDGHHCIIADAKRQRYQDLKRRYLASTVAIGG